MSEREKESSWTNYWIALASRLTSRPTNQQCSATEKDLIESLMKRFTCEDLLYSNPTVSLHSWMQSGAQPSIMTSDQCLFCLFMDDENKLLVVVDINDNKNNPEMMIVLLSCVPRFAHLSRSRFGNIQGGAISWGDSALVSSSLSFPVNLKCFDRISTHLIIWHGHMCLNGDEIIRQLGMYRRVCVSVCRGKRERERKS